MENRVKTTYLSALMEMPQLFYRKEPEILYRR
jgi:hypothetical protein